MSETDPRFDAPLEALWEATRAPADDLAFALAVEDRVARRLLLIDIAVRLVAGLAALVLGVAFWPVLAANTTAMLGSLDAAGPALAAAAVVAAGMLWLSQPPAEDSPPP